MYFFIILGIKAKDDREALLEAMMDVSERRSHLQHSRVKRGARRRHRPNWKNHPLYPLYAIDFEGKSSQTAFIVKLKFSSKGPCLLFIQALSFAFLLDVFFRL